MMSECQHMSNGLSHFGLPTDGRATSTRESMTACDERLQEEAPGQQLAVRGQDRRDRQDPDRLAGRGHGRGPHGQGPLLASIWTWLLGPRTGSLRGKRALVSGCGDGLGRELSLQLVRLGCRVVCIDQDAMQVQETLGLVQSQQLEDAARRGELHGHSLGGELPAKGFACDWRNPGEALGLSRTVTTGEGGVDLIFVVPESNNNNASAVDGEGKIVGNEFWPLLGFLPGMLTRARGHVVHVLDEQIAHKTGVVADAWIESLREVGAAVRYTKVYLHSDQTRHSPRRAEDAARAILQAVKQGDAEVHVPYPVC